MAALPTAAAALAALQREPFGAIRDEFREADYEERWVAAQLNKAA